MENALRTDYIVDTAKSFNPVQAQQNALQVQGMQSNNQLRELAIEEAKYLKSQRPFKRESEALKWFSAVTPLLTLQNLTEFREKAIQRGVSPELLVSLDDIQKWGAQDPEGAQGALEKFKLWSLEQLDIYKAQTSRRDAETRRIKAEQGPKPTSLIEQYNFAKQQFAEGKGKDPGSFTEWKKGVAKAGATNISFGEKVKLHEAKSEVSAKISLRKEIRSPRFKSNIIKDLKADPDFKYLETYEQEEKIFREMDKRVREAYPDTTIKFDEAQGGWVDTKSGKVVRKYSDVTPKAKRELFQKGGFSPRKREPTVNILQQ